MGKLKLGVILWHKPHFGTNQKIIYLQTISHTRAFPHCKKGSRSEDRNNLNILGNFRMQIVASLGVDCEYYGFRFVTPLPPQCVERFHHYRSNEKNIVASLLKFAGYIHNHKILPGNIFGLILKNKMAAMGISLSVMKSAYYWS